MSRLLSRIQLGLKLGFEYARYAVQYFQAYPPYHSRIVVKPCGKHLDQLHPLCNRLAEMLEADRMKFSVNPVMDFLPARLCVGVPTARAGSASFDSTGA